MLGRNMLGWPDIALRRVLDTPLEGWGAGGMMNAPMGWFMTVESGRKCLYQIATDHPSWAVAGLALAGTEGGQLVHRYDKLVYRFGLERVVGALKGRALKQLLSRNPLQPSEHLPVHAVSAG